MPAEAAFAAIALACLADFSRNVRQFLERSDSESVHDTRIAIRRLRAAMAMFKPMLAGEQLGGITDELRGFARQLGRARDLDVLMERANERQLRSALCSARDEAYLAIAQEFESGSGERLATELEGWIRGGNWRTDSARAEFRIQPIGEYYPIILKRWRRKIKRQGHELAALDDAQRHELRKTARKLRYGAEFIASLVRKKHRRDRHKRFVKALEALQDELGALNDMVTAPRLMRDLELDGSGGAERLLAQDGKRKLLHSAARRREDFLDVRPFWKKRLSPARPTPP